MASTEPIRRIDEEAALRAVVGGTASETGVAFYQALVLNLARALDTYGAWITEYLPESERLRALAFWFGDQWVEGYEYDIAGTPCETAIKETRLVHIPDRSFDLYPDEPEAFVKSGVVSYVGVPLFATDQRIIGHLAVVDVRPMPEEKRLLDLFQLFATRAAAEMRRLRLECELRERQERLGQLLDSAMDAIIELNEDLEVTLVNSAAEKLFSRPNARMQGEGAAGLLGEEATKKLRSLAGELDLRTGNERYLWIPEGLAAAPASCPAFHAEATLSRFERQGHPFYTLILRNVEDRLEAERRIRTLTARTEYLAQEIAADHGFDEIVGKSPALRRALRGVAQVAATEATVLILGETGTGKELFARAIHNRSPRREAPLIKVNCAAIPASLIESEFFGHERGAFTGATQRREGRFALAHGGTIFLDEIGELPLELQGKLLRVLQEGEFEPVGGSRTRKIDVRVLAATNRDLEAAVREGTFREDLYYRLAVFPLELPALRERGDDVVLLAASMVEKLSRDLGRKVEPLSPEDAAALRAYPWPGNVRELRNVIERALITSVDGQLHLECAVPGAEASRDVGAGAPSASGGPVLPDAILTESRMRELERDNMIAALEKSEWTVAGENGAARLLEISPSTLKSRMKALEIRRPR